MKLPIMVVSFRKKKDLQFLANVGYAAESKDPHPMGADLYFMWGEVG